MRPVKAHGSELEAQLEFDFSVAGRAVAVVDRRRLAKKRRCQTSDRLRQIDMVEGIPGGYSRCQVVAFARIASTESAKSTAAPATAAAPAKSTARTTAAAGKSAAPPRPRRPTGIRPPRLFALPNPRFG